MKRYAVFLLALALMGTAGLVYAHRVVSASAEAVEVRETVLYGDRAAAEGVELLMPAWCGGGRCMWNIDLNIGAENTAETLFTYKARFDSDEPYEHDYDGVRISIITSDYGSLKEPATMINKHWGPDFSEAEPLEFGTPPELLLDILLDVASRTGADEKRTERLEMGDYFDFLPLYTWLDLPYETCVITPEGETLTRDEAGGRLGNYFRLPVPEGLEADVTIEKDYTGNIVYWDFVIVNERSVYMYTLGYTGEDACYFSFEEAGEALDFSEMPYGRGIYRVPLDRSGETPVLRLDAIGQVLPLADGEQIKEMETAGGRFLLLTQLEEMLYLTSVNLEDMSHEQAIALCEHSGEEVVSHFILEDGSYYVETWERRYALAVPEGDGYRLRLSGVIRDPDWSFFGKWDTALLWDGGRLIAAQRFSTAVSDDGESEAGMRLWVYDGTGALCALRYDTSLSDPPCVTYLEYGRPSGWTVGMGPPVLSLH